VADWVGVDLEDPPGENLAEKAISAGGNYVGASTLAKPGLYKVAGVMGGFGWGLVDFEKIRVHLKP
jgi:hypothetical protein